MAALHISISAETVAHIGPLLISNSMLTSIIVSMLIVLFAVLVNQNLKTQGKPGRLQVLAEMIVEMLYNLCLDITGSVTKTAAFAPLVVAFFLFIILNNWAGLIPGVGTIGFLKTVEPHAALSSPLVSQVRAATNENISPPIKGEFIPYFRAGTADLNMTIALALISVGLTQYFGIANLGVSYFSKFFTFKNPIMTFVGFLETILEFAKIMSFAFRLFGNIFAGEVLLSVMMFLVPVIIPMPFYALELFVGFIQALVFSMLTLVFFNLATVGHGEEH